MKLYNILPAIASIFFLLLSSCKKADIEPIINIITETKNLKGESNLFKPGAFISVGASFQNNTGASISEKGICYVHYSSFDENISLCPSVLDKKIPFSSGGDFDFMVDMLLSVPGSTYKVRPYCFVRGRVFYGDMVEFKTNYLADGDKGDQGIQGPAGSKGDKGDQGIQGPAGSKGDKGDQGIQGPVGPKGDANVVQGPVGPKGDKGDQGIQGYRGLTGYKGDQGTKGPKGDRGDDLEMAPIFNFKTVGF